MKSTLYRYRLLVVAAALTTGLGGDCESGEPGTNLFVDAVCNNGDLTVMVGDTISITSTISASFGPALPDDCAFAWAVDPANLVSLPNENNCSPATDSQWTATATFTAEQPGVVKIRGKPDLGSAVVPAGDSLCTLTIVGGDASLPDAGPDGAPSDTSVSDVFFPDVRVCTTIQVPTAAVADPDNPEALVCNPPENVLTEDGEVVGLAYTAAFSPFEVAGAQMVACVRVDFGSVYEAEEVQLVIRAGSPVCGDACVGETCGTGHTVSLFGSTDATTYRSLGGLDVPSSLGRIAKTVTGQLRYVMVCRSAWGHGRDNLEVDVVELCTP